MPTSYIAFTQKALLLLVLLTCGFLAAQEQKKVFKKIGVTEGLPEEFARYVIQDEQGFIWIATQNGLVKYDGHTLKTFGPNAAYSRELRLRNLSVLFEDHTGLIWVSDPSLGGTASYNPRTENFTHYFLADLDSSYVDYEMSSLKRDLHGDLWFVARQKDRDSTYLGRLHIPDSSVAIYPVPIFGGQYLNDRLINLQLAERSVDSSIWVSSGGSLLRFNRTADQFDTVAAPSENLPGLAFQDSVLSLSASGPSGKITLGSRQHLYVFDPDTNSILHHKEFADPKEEAVLFPFEDDRGNFWGTMPGNLVRINGETGKSDLFTMGEGPLKTNTDSQEDAFAYVLHLDSEAIWFRWFQGNFLTGGSGYLRFDLQSENWEVWDGKIVQSDGNPVRAYNNFLKDHSGNLWIGTRPNLYKEDPRASLMDWYTAGDSVGLPAKEILRLHEDAANRVWVGTQDGLARFDGSGAFIPYKHSPSDPGSISDNRINHMLTDPEGRLWIATDSGLNLWQPNTDRFKRFLEGKNITYVALDSEGDLWMILWGEGILEMGSRGEVKRRITPSESYPDMTENAISIVEDPHGNIWWADPYVNEKGVYRYNQKTDNLEHFANVPDDPNSLPYNEMRGIYLDRAGNLIFASDGGTIARFDYGNNHFERFPEFGDHSITAMGQDAEENYYFGTYSTVGILKVDKDFQSFETLGEEKGLLHNDILSSNRPPDFLITDEAGRFYLPTYRGLSVFEPGSSTFRNFTDPDGFHTGSAAYRLMKRANGEIWIGSEEGLNRIYPERLDRVDSTLAKVWITGVTVNDSAYAKPDGELFTEAIPFTKQIELTHDQKDLSLDFVGLHYLRPEDNLYSWQLENYDEDWSDPSKDRRASYTNLSPGEYTFRVKASNADGVWNEEGAQIRITIRPPWWQTWWAYGGYLLILALLGYRLHLYQKQRTIRKERERAQAKELEQAKEIKKAYADLKATQQQLILSEKMASLGELTAGIAHEIQNPLNFVNNFSEVSSELVDEMTEELDRGDIPEAKAIAGDLKQNLEKIEHHGRRADSIVKGMLQHSRGSEGKKEPTDLNALADEYLRLAYHGLRAKDKSFNATMETDLDKKLPKARVVPQDIGRVLLNLLTNAFYAVNEKKKSAPESYVPTVRVASRKTPDGVEIEVSDNGNGMPKKVLDKIFQPFFTTKPAGQGTGLGLSMSYDIVKKVHGGELKVASREGDGTTFTVILPTPEKNKTHKKQSR